MISVNKQLTGNYCTSYKQGSKPCSDIHEEEEEEEEEDAFIHELINSELFSTLYDQTDVSIAWSSFKTEFLRICNKYAPIQHIRVKYTSKNWITSNIRELIHKRNHAHQKALRTLSVSDWEHCKSLRNTITSKIRKFKKQFYQSKIEASSSNASEMWKILKQVLPSNNKPSNHGDISAQAFNDFFSSIGTNLTSDFGDFSLPEANIPTPTTPFSFTLINENFVLHQLLCLPCVPKLDILDFDIKLLRLAAPLISPLLTHVYNLSLYSGTLPVDWKTSRVTPIYKNNGHKNDPSNYRPISVISPVAKILEKSVKQQLVFYLNKFHLLSTNQSAYRSNHSTQTVLHHVVDHLLDKVNVGKINISCFLDLSKGFDTLNTDILLHKISKHGVDNNSLTWFKSYLSDRKVIVHTSSSVSGTNNINIGVPQGTVLGPTLFLLYVNDLSFAITDASLDMYADDATISCFGDTLDEAAKKLNICLTSVSHWFNINRLVINTSKSNFLVTSTRSKIKQLPEHIHIKFNDVNLKRIRSTKLLGIFLDESLSFNDHITYLKQKVAPKIALIHRLRSFLPESSLNQVYLSLIHTLFDYCLTVWGNSSKQNLYAIQALQNRAARAVTGNFDFESSVSSIISNLEWMNIKQRLTYFQGLLMFKCLNNMAPSYLSDSLTYLSHHQSYTTRNVIKNHLTIPHPHLSIFKQSFKYSGPTLWNSLPLNITEVNSLTHFKHLLRRFVLSL